MLMNLFVQLWTPHAGEPSIVAGSEAGPEAVDAARVMAENQLQMRRHQEIGLPMELLQRFKVQEGGEHPF
ncbi:unnamed protein product [Sphagnum troendelagicum]|uniref:Uncharacterized protein n=1 Tax=Sphagnum troendelagicum TaxID=128251 RepID=A0ABP0V2H4_9BRYO